MQCPKCSELFLCKQGFLEHVETHGVDPWRIKQLLAEWSIHTAKSGPHAPGDPCKCRAYGAKFECELKVL